MGKQIILIGFLAALSGIEPLASKDSSRDSELIKNMSHRPLRVGDIFTPVDMLPITRKLITKVDNPGLGKGIVSSEKSPEVLADKLFAAFFFTSQRIVRLTGADIPGLDALQALALSGEVADKSYFYAEPKKKPLKSYLRGGHNGARQSKYKLVTKVDTDFKKSKNRSNRREIAIEKKLKKMRHLVVNGNMRKNFKRNKTVVTKNNVNRNIEDRVAKSLDTKSTPYTNNEVTKSKENREKDKNRAKSTCRWRYVCTNPANLDTCRLRTQCFKQKHIELSTIDYIDVPHKSDERTSALKQFRKMLRISIVDEEVEKILENRVLHFRPQNMDAGGRRMERLVQHFNRNIMIEKTTPTNFNS